MARAYNNLPDYEGLEKAAALLESVRDEGKDDPLWHYRLGYALFFLERNKEALTCFRRSAELDPDIPDIQYFIRE